MQLHPLSPLYGTACLRHKNGGYFSMKDGKLVLADERFLWRIEAFEGDRFFLGSVIGRTLAEYYFGELKVAVDSGYSVQHWRLYRTEDGYLAIEHADTPGHFLFRTGDGTLALSESADADIAFCLEDAALTEGFPYIEVSGREGMVYLRMAQTVLSFADREWLGRWASAIEEAAHAMCHLTGWLPHTRIEVRAYTDCAPWGYVFREKPVIHVNRASMEEDIIKMRMRPSRDLSFGILHELSHLYDKEDWMFDGEALANLKIPYALRALWATAAPAELPPEETLSHETMLEGLYRLDGRLEEERGRFSSSLGARLIEMVNELGWDSLRRAFRLLPAIPQESRLRRLEVFLEMLGKAAGRDAAAMLTPREWEIIRRHLG